MASTKHSKKEEDKTKQKNNDKRSHQNGKALGITKSSIKGKKSPVAPKSKSTTKTKSTPKKTTSVKTSNKAKTPTKPKQGENSKKKKKKKEPEPEPEPEPEELVVPSSSCESETEEGEAHVDEGKATSKSSKSSKTENGKRKKENARDENDDDEDGREGNDGTMCRFPMARIRRIMTSETPNLHPGLEGQDVVFVVNRATELFLEKFSEEAHRSAVNDRKKTLDYKHLATVVSQSKRFEFLSDFVPLKLKAADALEARKSAENPQG